ncbi:hypothetical protein [Bifidobacterium mongoliense]
MSEYEQDRRLGIAQEHENHMQTDEFYRRVGIEKLEHSLTFWAHYLVNLDEIGKDSQSGLLVQRLKENKELIIVYGSARTIHDLGSYQQFIANDKSDYNQSEIIIFFAQLIADLKYDFTGIRVNPIDLLRTQVNDLSSPENEELFASAYRSVMDMLNVPKKERAVRRRRWFRKNADR